VRKHGFWLSPCSGRARLKLRRGDAIDSAAFFGRLGWRELSFRSMREEDKRPGALALESFTGAARSLIFIAPAGLGVQEAGLVGIGHVLGLGSDVAIALSLAKRMREVLFGLPALAAWQWMTRAKAW